MAKQAKLPQTDWTRGGMQISNTATPLYQKNLTRMDEYLSNPQKALDDYLTKYYGSNAIQNQDFLRAYNRAMGQRTGANFAATGGGYTSSGQRAYDDSQRYYNDLAARLNQYGINSSYSMSNQDYQNMLAANQAYNNAYGLGKNYSDIETQNYLADQANKNWWSSALSGLGNVGMAVGQFTGNPVVAGLGALATGVGSATRTEIPAGYGVSANDTYTNLINNLNQYNWGKILGNNRNNNSNNNIFGLSQDDYNKIMNAKLGGTNYSAITPNNLQTRNYFGL